MDARADAATADARARDLVVTRFYEAPRELVFRAWTNAEDLKRWWAPKGCSTPHASVDLRVGGAFHYCMRLPDGRDIWGLGVYREIAPPGRIAYTDTFADERGRKVPPAHYGFAADHPDETRVTVTFEEKAGGTLVTVRHEVGAVDFGDREGMRQGWTEMLAHLAGDLGGGHGAAGSAELLITRAFDAPRTLVWRAWTEPEHLVHWSAPHGYAVVECSGDLRPGGWWRSCMRSPEGVDLWNGGTYIEVTPPERLVFTFAWDDEGGRPGLETLVTLEFAEADGRTTMTFRQTGFESEDSRDGHGGGWSQSFEKLATYLAAAGQMR
jgi:uncharacterized protein YndB with AHSA1/START domain